LALSLLLGLAPFAGFFVVTRLVSPMAGLVAALAISALLCMLIKINVDVRCLRSHSS